MKEKGLLLLILILIISCKTVINNDKKEQLFNGKNLNGWIIYGDEKWFVKENLLVCETVSKKGFGYLITNKEYKNFELNLEFKHETIGNSGIFLHSNFKKTKINGWQVEIGPPGHKTAGIHKYNKGWLAIPDTLKDRVLKMNEWNKMKIILNNDSITTWLNGTKMVSATDAELNNTTGGIAIQIRDKNAKMKWKNIEIIEL
jgi:hypothetical protein